MDFTRADLRLGELDHPAVVELLYALDKEIRARHDEPVEDFVLELDSEDVALAHGAFVVAWADERQSDAAPFGSLTLGPLTKAHVHSFLSTVGKAWRER